MTLQEIIPSLRDAKTVGEILTAEVQTLYRAEPDAVRRASISGELRNIAKKNGIVKPFNTALSALDASIKEAKRTADKKQREAERVAARERREAEKAAAKEQSQNVSIDSVAAALKDLGITVRYNELLKETEVHGLPGCYSKGNAVNTLPIYLMDFLRKCGFSGVTQQMVDGCLACIADQNRYNPVLEYLQAGTWDGVDRFPEIYRILGVKDPVYQTYIRKWFIQCVALGLNNEEKPVGADGMLVLQGEQGIAKTSFFRIMSPFHRWFVEGAILDMNNKDTIITALSGWITELGELDSTIKKEQMSIKAFITRPDDRIRTPYARNDTRAPRRTSFCGTVNPKNYLKDETGSRRFWTVPVEYIDKQVLFSLHPEWVKQLWFQTYCLYQLDPCDFRLTDKERDRLQRQNREFSVSLRYEEEIRELLDLGLPLECWEWWRSVELIADDLLPSYADSTQIGRALAKVAREIAVEGHKHSRTVHGNQEFRIPLKHYQQN